MKINPEVGCSVCFHLKKKASPPLAIFLDLGRKLGRPWIPGAVNSLIRGVSGGSLQSSDERLGKASPELSPLCSLMTEQVEWELLLFCDRPTGVPGLPD